MDTDTSKKILTDDEKKKLAEEFRMEIEARLEKEERHLRILKDHDHIHQNE